MTRQEFENLESQASTVAQRTIKVGALVSLIGATGLLFFSGNIRVIAAIAIVVGITCVQVGSFRNRRAAKRLGLVCPGCGTVFRRSLREALLATGNCGGCGATVLEDDQPDANGGA